MTGFVFFALFLGSGIALGLRLRRRTPDPAARSRIANRATRCGLFVLMPVHIALSGFLPTQMTAGATALAALSAVLFCALCYGLSRAQQPLPWAGPAIYPGVSYLACTFGGGNRGIIALGALVLLAAPFTDAVSQSTVIDTFATFDIAYFAFFMIVGHGYAMRRDYPRRDDGEGLPGPATSGGFFGKYYGSIAVAAAILVSMSIKYGFGWSEADFDRVLPVGVTALRAVIAGFITLFAALQLTLAFTPAVRFANLARYVSVAYSARIAAAAILYAGWGLAGLLPSVSTALVTTLLIMIVLPPSSLLEGLMEDVDVPYDERREMATFNSILNLGFVAVTTLLFAIALAAAGLRAVVG